MMQFNPSKCATMSIATRNPTKPYYNFCGQQLESVASHPYLGVELTNTLNWGIQTSLCVKKAQRALGVIKRNLGDCNREVKVTAYQAIVRPLLEYTTSAWDPHSKCNIEALEKVQKQAARFCMKDYSRLPGTMTNLMTELDWQPLDIRRKMARVTMMYKMVNGLVDIDINNYAERTSKLTRGNNHKFHTQRWNIAAFRDSFFPMTICDWNQLPDHVANSISLETFKTNIRKHYSIGQNKPDIIN